MGLAALIDRPVLVESYLTRRLFAAMPAKIAQDGGTSVPKGY